MLFPTANIRKKSGVEAASASSSIRCRTTTTATVSYVMLMVAFLVLIHDGASGTIANNGNNSLFSSAGIFMFAAAASSIRGGSASSDMEEDETEPQNQQQQKSVVYGTQCSFGITGPTLDGCDSSMLDHRQEFYDNYMQGCNDHYGKGSCNEEEESRWRMNIRQPQSMINMTKTGYHKVKAPDTLIKMLTDFWEKNKAEKQEEDWGDASVYTNHWESPTYMVSVEDQFLEGGGKKLKKAIWDAAVDGIAQWTGGIAKLRPVSLYGIREYTRGAVLSPHVDRVPLVSSGIVNVAQDVDEPWPLEVYDRHGHAVNITMEPGDMIFYESHSLIHGRPFPLKGKYYANVFIHFEPYDGWENAHDKVMLGDSNGDLPPYIIPGSPEEESYREDNPGGWSKYFVEGEEPDMAMYAAEGMLDELKQSAEVDPRLLWHPDENGWTPLHEAVRSAQVEVVKYLIDSGAGVNDKTSEGTTPLRMAINYLGNTHEITTYLRSIDAEDAGEADIDDDIAPGDGMIAEDDGVNLNNDYDEDKDDDDEYLHDEDEDEEEEFDDEDNNDEDANHDGKEQDDDEEL